MASIISTAESPLHSQKHILPPPFSTSPEPFDLIFQGAEALLFKTTFLSPTQHIALKVRPAKKWRHPILDKRLTRQRILAEARVLVKCRREGVRVPSVLGMSWDDGWIALEWIEGGSVRDVIRKGIDGDEGLKLLLRKIGKAVGELHKVGVVHGDLTTSNMIVSPTGTADSSGEGGGGGGGEEGEIVLIDFGLATQATQEEDRAVDLYVLERAFGSTHPREEGMFGVVLEAYGNAYKGAKQTLKKLEDVRMRGRKKSMIG